MTTLGQPIKYHLHRGQRFSRLTVIGRVRSDGKTRKVRVRCVCGVVRDVLVWNLVHGNTRSCGCWQKARASSAAKTHGQSRTRLYNTWKNMRYRCENPVRKDWHRYGGRGIRVCKAWQRFENFYQWALTSGYKLHLTLDRVKNGRGYWPSNCRWATYSEQRRNQRRYRLRHSC